MIVDELTLHLKGLLFEKDNRFSPLIIERFFRILADTKDLLSLGSDGEFSLSLALFKMVESLSVHDIDDMIRTLQKELSPVSASTTPAVHAPTKQEKSEPTATAAPEAAAPSVTERKTEPVASPVPEAPAAKEESASPEPQSAPKESTPETTAAPQPEPAPAAPSENYGRMFQQLQKKIYDRDYDLGNCFERNITFESFDNGALTWHSSAQGDDKKMLISHWGIIRMFVQELFGLETKIVNIPTEPKPEPEESKKKRMTGQP